LCRGMKREAPRADTTGVEMKRKLTLAAAAATVVSLVLAASSGAAKPTYSVRCGSQCAALTWTSGTTGADATFYSGADLTGDLLATDNFTTLGGNGPGSRSIPTIGLTAPVLSIAVTYHNKKGVDTPKQVNCTT